MPETPHVHVLLIEDSLSDQFLISELLTSSFAAHGITLSLAGVAFRLGLARGRLHELSDVPSRHLVVIVDLNLPDSRGVDTYRALEPLLEGTIHLVLTEDADAVDQLLSEGVHAMHKGTDISALPAKVLELTGLHPDPGSTA